MTQEEVHRQLSALHKCKEDFTVTFSGRKCKTVNGTYKPFSRAITVHNRNFINENGALNETMLMYTAIHELAHHIQDTERGHKGSRSHTQLFYSIFDDLLDRAEEAGIYKIARDSEIEELIAEAEMLSAEIAKLQRELGGVLIRLNDACHKKGIRYEDAVTRGAKISLQTAKKTIKMRQLDLPSGIGADIQEAIAAECDRDKRKQKAAAAQAGKSVAQVKKAGSPPPSGRSETEEENLLREKGRLEKTIAELQRRLRRVTEQLNAPGVLQQPRAAERR